MKLRTYISMMMLGGIIMAANADNDTPVSQAPIVGHIISDSTVTLTIPDALLLRLQPVESHESETVRPVNGKMGGYRIQVFSDNNARTAKGEARTRARNVSARFPQYPTYVVYNSPFWRLRVGNFRTQEEANEAAQELKEAFPSYMREIRVVRDRIVVSSGE